MRRRDVGGVAVLVVVTGVRAIDVLVFLGAVDEGQLQVLVVATTRERGVRRGDEPSGVVSVGLGVTAVGPGLTANGEPEGDGVGPEVAPSRRQCGGRRGLAGCRQEEEDSQEEVVGEDADQVAAGDGRCRRRGRRLVLVGRFPSSPQEIRPSVATMNCFTTMHMTRDGDVRIWTRTPDVMYMVSYWPGISSFDRGVQCFYG